MSKNIQSPYSTKFFSGEIKRNLDPSSGIKAYKKEELETHSPRNILPYELSNLPEYFANIVSNSIEAGRIIESVIEIKEFSNEEKENLLKLKKATEKIIDFMVKNVDSILEPLTIGNKHAIDDIEDAKTLEKQK